MSELNNSLFSAIVAQDVNRVRQYLEAGADPNAVNEYGDSALVEACDSWLNPEIRFQIVQSLLDAGADPRRTGEGGPLFSCVIAKDARLLEYLVSRGADPNKEHDEGETLYDWAEFDYRNDEYELNVPEEPTEADTSSEDAWLLFMSRLAVKYGKRPPDCLLVLRRAGAITGRERTKIPPSHL